MAACAQARSQYSVLPEKGDSPRIAEFAPVYKDLRIKSAELSAEMHRQCTVAESCEHSKEVT